jgi:ornithine cyclodeaminase/alanine dehydrogenase-like protein (mu-crystallin family)
MAVKTDQIRILASASCFVLSYEEVASLLANVRLATFVKDLAGEIMMTYSEDGLKSMRRTGWPRPPETLEVMGCQSTNDFTCVKLISSNPQQGAHTLPTVMGTMVCTEYGTDRARLVCDASLLTPLRTAASTAVVMRELVPDVETLGIIGAGREGTSHGFVLATMLGRVRRIVLYDIEEGQATRAVVEVERLLARAGVMPKRKMVIEALDADHRNEVYACDAVVTATYGNTGVLEDSTRRPLKDGTFIAAVGADLEGKRELEHNVYERAKFVADDLGQSLWEGEIQNTIGKLDLRGVRDRWNDQEQTERHRGKLLGGRIVSVSNLLEDITAFARRSEPITVYDSTGFSGQDLALGRLLYRLLKRAKWPAVAWNPASDESLSEVLERQERTNGRSNKG